VGYLGGFGDAMGEQKDNLQEICDLLNLESRGVRVKATGSDSMGGELAGVYSFFRCEISIRNEVIPYWYVTWTTLLHEYGHHRQRLRWGISLAMFLVGIIGSWLYSILSPSWASNMGRIVVGVAIVVIAVSEMKWYFEPDAEGYMTRHTPPVFILLSRIEMVQIADSLKTREKAIPRTLRALREGMQEHHPDLLERATSHEAS